MKISIWNGNPSLKNQAFESYLSELSTGLIEAGHEVRVVDLKGLEINDCIGCYGCWLKTPGICVFKDDVPSIIKAYLEADVVLMASPLIMGFVSACLKRVQERMLPIVHPYLYMDEDRMSHIPRYSHYPRRALLLDQLSQAKPGTLEILEKVNSGGGKNELLFTLTMENPVEEVIHAFNRF